MKNTTITLLGLSLGALASFTLAQEPAETPAPTAPAAAETPAPAATETPAPEATETPAPEAAEAPAPAAAEAPAPAATEAPAPATPSDAEVKEVISYFLGHQTGQQFASDSAGPMSIDDIDKDTFFRAIEDGMNNRVDPEIDKKDLRANIMAYSAKLEARSKAASEKNLAASQAYAEENGKKEGVVTTESGLQYKVLTPSEGRKYDAEKDGEGAEMSVTYEGRLLDGTIFDKSDTPVNFPITGVIPGFSEALKLIPVGAEYEIFLPSSLGYGEHGPGILGSNAALIFKVKLHDIMPKKGSAENPIELTPELLQQLQESGMQPVQQ